MDDEEEFTFETAPFPPNTQIDDEILPNKTISTVVNCIVSLPTDSTSPFLTLAAALPNPINNPSINSGCYLVSVPGILDNEVNHAKEVLKLFPAFSEVRRRIVPRLVNDEKFWQAYFALLAIQTRYETRQQAMFGGDGHDENDENENESLGNNNAPPSSREIAMMSARVVLRMPTPGFVFKNIRNSGNKHKDTTTTSSADPTASSSSLLDAASPTNSRGKEDTTFSASNTTRIVPGKRLKVPPSLCIAVRESTAGAGSPSGGNGESGGGGVDVNRNNRTSLLTSTSTMLMGKDLMTKHMRDQWRQSLNDLCAFDFQIGI